MSHKVSDEFVESCYESIYKAKLNNYVQKIQQEQILSCTPDIIKSKAHEIWIQQGEQVEKGFERLLALAIDENLEDYMLEMFEEANNKEIEPYIVCFRLNSDDYLTVYMETDAPLVIIHFVLGQHRRLYGLTNDFLTNLAKDLNDKGYRFKNANIPYIEVEAKLQKY